MAGPPVMAVRNWQLPAPGRNSVSILDSWVLRRRCWVAVAVRSVPPPGRIDIADALVAVRLRPWRRPACPLQKVPAKSQHRRRQGQRFEQRDRFFGTSISAGLMFAWISAWITRNFRSPKRLSPTAIASVSNKL